MYRIKSDSKKPIPIYFTNTVLFKFPFKESQKNIGLHKNIKWTFFNIDKKKSILNSKASYQNYFWKIMWHWKLEWWLLKIQLCKHRKILILKYIQIE